MKKFIFLDCDGVMNNERDIVDRTKDGRDHEIYTLETRCIKLLRELVENTGAKVVLTTTWRKLRTLEELKILFHNKGFNMKHIIDVTPDFKKKCGSVRGNEIHDWLEKNLDYNEFHRYVIFDDDSDMLYWQRNNFLLCDGYIGLTPNLCYKAKRILNGEA